MLWKDFIDAFRYRRPPVFPVYGSASYSNAGTNLVGLVVEAVSGKSFAEDVQDTISGPVGLTNTTLTLPENLEWLFIPTVDAVLDTWKLGLGALAP
jgi:CubicO group peptidase (beta-lactamase class C family)